MARERDITVDVTIRSDTKGAKEAERALGDVDKAAAGAGKSMHGMEVDSKALGSEIEKSKGRVKDLEAELVKVGNNPGLRKALRTERSWLTELEKIHKEVEATAAAAKEVNLEPPVVHAKSLNAELARTRALVQSLKGQVAADISFLPDLKREKSKLKELENLAGDAASAGVKVGGSFIDGIGSAMGGAKQYAIPALIALGVAVSPAIGAIIGGAVVGAVGAGGIVGGIAAAAQDSRVQAEWKNFTSSLDASDFASNAFVKPTIEGIGILKAGFADLHIDDALRKGAAAVPDLARGVSDFANGVMPGFNDVMDHSGEISKIFADGLGDVGNSLGDALTTMVESKGAMEGLKSIFALTSATIGATGDIVGALSDAFHGTNVAAGEFTGAMEDIYGWLPGVGSYMAALNDHFEELTGKTERPVENLHRIGVAAERAKLGLDPMATSAKIAGQAVADLGKAVDEAFKKQMDADRATMGWEASLDKLAASVKENGKSLDVTTEKGRANRDAVLDSVKAAQDQRTANIDSGMSAGDAAIQYDKQIDKLKGLASHLGISKKELDKLAGNYFINITTTERHIIQETHREDYRAYGPGGNPSPSSGGGRAAGGPVMAGVPYTINERGFETVTFPAGGTVHPAHLTPMAAGGNTVNYYLTVNAPPLSNPVEVGATVVAAVRQYEMANGAGWRS